MPKPLKFIITADDFGVSPVIDNAIREGIDAGFITSVAAFANVKNGAGKFHPEKVITLIDDLAKAGKKVSVGLHFTITSGYRVSKDSISLSPIIKGKREDYFRGPGGQAAAFGKLVEEAHLLAELRAQVKVFQDHDVKIDHFSDHHGLLSHTPKGIDALTKVINEYDKSKKLRPGETRKPTPYRNPFFISKIVKDDAFCLSKSASLKRGKVPLAFQHILHLGNLRGWFATRRKRLQKRMEQFHTAGIPTTDYFIETYYGFLEDRLDDLGRPNPSDRVDISQRLATLQCLFNSENYPDISIQLPISETERTAEMMVHLAKPKLGDAAAQDPYALSDEEYEKGIEEIAAYSKTKRGLDVEYTRNHRPQELQALRDNLFQAGIATPDDLRSFIEE